MRGRRSRPKAPKRRAPRAHAHQLGAPPRRRRKPAREQLTMRLPETGFALEIQEDSARARRIQRAEEAAIEKARADAAKRQRSLFGGTKTVCCSPEEARKLYVGGMVRSTALPGHEKTNACRLLFRRAMIQAGNAIEPVSGGTYRVRDCDALAEAREAYREGMRCEEASRR